MFLQSFFNVTKHQWIVVCMLLSILLIGCSKDYYCSDVRIVPMFIGYSQTDIDTILVKQYSPNENFQTLIDSFEIVNEYSTNYVFLHDTIGVFYNTFKEIKAGFDWQISIPAINKNLWITHIDTEKRTMRCNWGIFSMGRTNCTCSNRIFSLQMNNSQMVYPDSSLPWYPIYIKQ